MIKKFLKINNFGVFKDFEWDMNVVDYQGKPIVLRDVNILFGRNYSGKTTITRILRAFEVNGGLENYEGGTFSLETNDKNTFDESTLKNLPYPVRVFNEDFTRENLLFANDPEQGVAPFAVLGENVEIEQEIQRIKKKLGSPEEGSETGLYREKLEATNAYNTALKKYQDEHKRLELSLKDKAISGRASIRNQPLVYGDQNYNISKFKQELDSVTQKDILTDERVDELKATLKEDLKQIPNISKVAFPDFNEINKRAKSITEQQIIGSDKIEELVHNAMAHKWVEEGCELHRNRKTCFFCGGGGTITDSRWTTLERHYDEATKDLKTKVEETIQWINEMIQTAKELYKVPLSNYYSCFRNEVEEINKDMDALRNKLISTLESILGQLKSKKESIHTTLTYTEYTFDITQINDIYQRIQKLNERAERYGRNLSKMRIENQTMLRRSEVARFKKETRYSNTLAEIEEKKHTVNKLETIKKQKEYETRTLEDKIKADERHRQNEENGARKVNEILQSYFGLHYIELKSIMKGEDEGLHFDVFRQNKKAYNLSEGERNLIAFAYFVAKLSDVHTASKMPIIWIDDPISSLDANHIFFIFSLIDQLIIANGQWTQLFISTHNLDFLRYLKRIHTEEQRECFLIERQGDKSCLRCMPKYMKEHTTEFNYLFHQIFKCSQTSETENYELFYNFGNNARKFLEAYLYYKYPDNERNCLHEKMKRFFSNGCVATTINRIDNELSHLEGLIERGMSISDHAEIKKCAQYILEAIKTKDPDQYNALLESIGASKKE